VKKKQRKLEQRLRLRPRNRMPIIRMKDIRAMSPEDRKKRLTELRTELMRLRTMVKAGGAPENPSQIQEIRRTIARILTVDNEETRIVEEKR
jgi:large subunit ribosomal protein L29